MSSAEATSQSSREYLMNVAEQLMAARGYHRTSIADIRRASGLPVGSS
ncbi:MAG: TetR family transcriptional regulator [Rhodococcus ruber]|nr:TetR family transcriptional regulator [Rhodococcus ruber]